MTVIKCLPLLFLSVLVCVVESAKDELPLGYYAFEVMHGKHNKPPQVKKPPYLISDHQCPGAVIPRFSPKHTLCGDLNKGLIPQNPMGQNVERQPYPFELIKNKTLHFLAKTLPILKQEMHNIPKVARYYGNSIRPGQMYPLNKKRMPVKREVHEYKVLNTAHRPKPVDPIKSHPSNASSANLPEGRQKCSEDSNTIFCQLMQSLNGESTSKPVQVLNAVLQATKLMNDAATIGNMLGLSPENSQSSVNKSAIAQLLTSLSGSNSYSPLTAVLDYLSTTLSNNVPTAARRKKPSDFEEVFGSDSVISQVPPTPCPAVEEYISPSFARNYQGIWKYVVQIPAEGYFTQTVQRTTCLWVSLLVAEIFYPNAYFPINVAKQKLPVKVYPTNLDATMQNFYNFQQFLRRSDQRSHKDHRKVSSYMALAKRDDDITPRKRRAVNSKPPGEEGELTDDKNKNECDGYDEIGCYVVRIYYDWFLVPGSCKCWVNKSNPESGINNAIKRIFLGK